CSRALPLRTANRCKTIDRFSRNAPLEIDRHQNVRTPLLTLARVSYTAEQAKFESNLKTVQPDWRRAFRGLYMGSLDLVYKRQRDATPDQLQRAVYKVCASEY
ncbi:hypothetical protein QZM26_19940, partial [Burkholderia multivorans]|nr:hypothetical protein [Burkholderia multivorans]